MARGAGGNTRFWRGREVSDYDRKQRLLVMRKHEALQCVARVLPFPLDWQGRVLDVGAGQGELTRAILRRFPCCRVTLFDASEEMLGEARHRLSRQARRVEFVSGNFNAEKWHANLHPPYDAIVSALALQYLDPRRRPRFFRRVWALLASEGWFVDLGSFAADDPHLEGVLQDAELRFVQSQLLRLEGRHMTLAELAQIGEERAEQAGVCRSTLQTELRHLQQAGFRADCVWRQWRIAVVAAHKGGPRASTAGTVACESVLAAEQVTDRAASS